MDFGMERIEKPERYGAQIFFIDICKSSFDLIAVINI